MTRFWERIITHPSDVTDTAATSRIRGRGVVRAARAEDLPAVVDLQKRSFHDVAVRSGTLEISPMTQTLADLRQQFTEDLILVHETDGVITGSVRAHVSADKVGHIGRLIVDPSHRRQGIGSFRMTEIERALPDCLRFDLFTGAQFDEVVRLYQGLGYGLTHEAELDSVPMVFMSKPNVRAS